MRNGVASGRMMIFWQRPVAWGGIAGLCLAACLLLAASSPGYVEVTTTMTGFAPAMLRLGSTADSTLRAMYTPPPGVPEGQLSAVYDFSVTKVLYTQINGGAYTTAPSSSYTASITPAQPSASSTAQLAFTPHQTAYWEVYVICDVVVNDSVTGQQWVNAAGSGQAGPDHLTCYTFDITYTGTVAANNVNTSNTTDSNTVVTNQHVNVHAGWPINLGVKIAPADLNSVFSWAIAGAGGNGSGAIAGWNPTSGPTYVQTLVPGAATEATFGPYYYTTANSYTATVKAAFAELPPAQTTFNVAKPTAVITTITDRVNVWSASGTIGFGGWMAQPQKDGGKVGIQFTDTPDQNSGFEGKFNWIQIYAPDDVFWNTTGVLLGTESGAGLDSLNKSTGGVFYGINPPDDSPLIQPKPGSNYGKIAVNDGATMWLMYLPSATGSIWVPVADVAWSWAGTETLANGAWTLAGGAWVQNPTGSATNAFPAWGGYVN